MNNFQQERAASAELPGFLLPGVILDSDALDSVHTTRSVWIRGRQYFLDVTVDPLTFEVLSYGLRPAPREKRSKRPMVA